MMVLLSIICFVIGISVLVVVHEFGHFICAKMFNVYCYEFSIGFGHKIFRKKMKNKETYFAIGVIPLGGYVSMYGEDEDEDKKNEESLNSSVNENNGAQKSSTSSEIENLHIPFNRSLEGISKPKKALIMSAGIILNFVLGYALYFIAVSCFPYNQYFPYLSLVNQEDTSSEFTEQYNNLSADLGNDEFLAFESSRIYVTQKPTNYALAISNEVYINDNNETRFVLFANNSFKINDLRIDTAIHEEERNSDDGYYHYYLYRAWFEDLTFTSTDGTQTTSNVLVFNNEKTFYDEFPNETINKMTLKFNVAKGILNRNSSNDVISYSVDKNYSESMSGTLAMDTNTGLLTSTNLNAMKDYQRYLGIESFGVAGEKWATGCGAVFNGLGQIFSGKNLDQLGGIVMIFAQTSVVLESYPFSYYIEIWALISVNLAIMNLLPIPGLDGWHLLITAIEGITRKKVNAKFKRYVTLAGFIFLFGLMGFLIIWDIIRLAVGVII